MTTAAPEARVLTESALTDLEVELADASDPKDFLSRAEAVVRDPSRSLALPTPLGPPDPLTPGPRGAIDVDNAPLVHEYLGEMDRANAADPRLWTYLAFATYRDYMLDRWGFDDVTNWQSRVRSRWLLSTASRGTIDRHGIARLWWVSHLTWDPGRDDPYELTRLVFSNEDRVLALFDRDIGAIPTVTRTVLAHVASSNDHGSGAHIRDLMRGLTLAHGYRDLGLLEEQDVQRLVDIEVQHMARRSS